jgi:hypothetical protein
VKQRLQSNVFKRETRKKERQRKCVTGSKVILTRTLTILVEVMDAVRVTDDDLDLIYLGDQLRGTIYKH